MEEGSSFFGAGRSNNPSASKKPSRLRINPLSSIFGLEERRISSHLRLEAPKNEEFPQSSIFDLRSRRLNNFPFFDFRHRRSGRRSNGRWDGGDFFEEGGRVLRSGRRFFDLPALKSSEHPHFLSSEPEERNPSSKFSAGRTQNRLSSSSSDPSPRLIITRCSKLPRGFDLQPDLPP